MDSNKIAGVLEEAARLYRDEKVEWCNGSWVDTDHFDGKDLDEHAQDKVLSVCAEGALLKAAGFSWSVLDGFGDMAGHKEKGYLGRIDPEGMELFVQSRDALGRFLLEHQDEHMVNENQIMYATEFSELQDVLSTTPIMVSVTGWNDRLLEPIINKIMEDKPYVVDNGDVKKTAKAVVIDAMEAAAKDLRNG